MAASTHTITVKLEVDQESFDRAIAKLEEVRARLADLDATLGDDA